MSRIDVDESQAPAGKRPEIRMTRDAAGRRSAELVFTDITQADIDAAAAMKEHRWQVYIPRQIERLTKQKVRAAYPVDEQLSIMRSGDQQALADMNAKINEIEAYGLAAAAAVREGRVDRETFKMHELAWPERIGG